MQCTNFIHFIYCAEISTIKKITFNFGSTPSSMFNLFLMPMEYLALVNRVFIRRPRLANGLFMALERIIIIINYWTSLSKIS